MTLAETIIKKVLELPADKQLELLDLVAQLEDRKSRGEFHDPEGLLADLPTHLTFEDFQKNRHEIWGSASDRELN